MDSYSYRESTVYVQPDVEGYLEKMESGVFRTKKPAKRWCWIQGSIFYQQKPQTNSSGPGGIDVLDMADVHYVRNLSADKTGTQFEIFIKKSQVYVCSNRAECTTWIQALQKAMAIKQTRQTQEPALHKPGNDIDTETYSVISDVQGASQQPSSKMSNGLGHATSAASHQNNTSTENVYSMPQDLGENVYSDVADVSTTNGGILHGASDTTDKPALPPPRSPIANGNGSGGSVYADGFSTGPEGNGSCSVDNNATGADEPCYAEGVSTGPTKPGKYVKKVLSGKKSGSLKPLRKAPVAPHVKDEEPPRTVPPPQQPDSVENVGQMEDSTNSEDLLMDIFNAMNIESPMVDLEYVITNDDAKPVTNLKTFLRQNDVHCRVSMNRLSQSQDPVTSCKAYISTLDNLM